jgi:adenosylcobinamide kinase/adenosylcobinamide-phosphate guanylyltransferase
MSNLVANEMFSDKGAKEITREAVLQGVEKLNRQADHLVVVTNNVFEAGSDYDSGTLEYLSVLGEINNRLCSQADQVIEVIHGIPVFIKHAEGGMTEGSRKDE